MLPTNRKNASDIWTMMTKIGPNIGRCNICSQDFLCNRGTSNMWRHVKNNHNTTFHITKKRSTADETKSHTDEAGAPLDNPSMPQKRRKNSSNIWTLITRTGPDIVKCNICNRYFRSACDNTSTANLWRHVKLHHNITRDTFHVEMDQNTNDETRSSAENDSQQNIPSMQPMNRKNVSNIWTVMTRIGPSLGRCNICNEEFKCDKGTSGMWHHIKTKHNITDETLDIKKDHNVIDETSSSAEANANMLPIKRKNVSDIWTTMTGNGPGLGRCSITDETRSSVEDDANMMPFKRKNASDIWTIMTRNGPGLGRCNICNQEFRCDKGTSNMWRHLKTKHKFNDEGFHATNKHDECTPSIKTDVQQHSSNPTRSGKIKLIKTINRVVKGRPGSDRVKSLDKKLLAMIYKDMQPFSVVDDAGFKDFCQELDGRYELPNRHQLKRALLIAYDEKKAALIYTLGKVDSLAITTDLWTSINMESYLTVTAHFLEPFPSWTLHSTVLATRPESRSGSTGTGIAEIINEILDEFNINSKVITATTDDTSVMANLVKDHLKVLHFRCFAQSLNLIVIDAIKSTEGFSSLIDEVKEVINHFHKNAKATTKLKSVLSDMGMKDLKLYQDFPTRWNSTLKMLRRYVELHQAVSGALKALGKVDLIISDEKVEVMKSWCESLQPFEEATELMSTQKRTSLSQVLMVVRQLQHFLTNESSHTALSNNLLIGISDRFHRPEENFTGAAATLLDPRFKRLPFVDEDLRKSHEEKIINMMMRSLREDERSDNGTVDSGFQHQPPPKKKSFMESFVASVKQVEKVDPEYMNGPREELQRFMEMKYLDIKKDPNVWWSEHAALFPHLSSMARKFIFIPGTSVPSNHLFSKAGEQLSRKRSCLKDSTIDMILFLNSNNRFDTSKHEAVGMDED